MNTVTLTKDEYRDLVEAVVHLGYLVDDRLKLVFCNTRHIRCASRSYKKVMNRMREREYEEQLKTAA